MMMKIKPVMRLLICSVAGGVLFGAQTVRGEELPDFLTDGQMYASDWRACVGFGDAGAPDDSYTLDQSGLFGYEVSCTFVEFKPVIFNKETGEITSYVAIASCGDDSGINRPDLFEISSYDETVTLTSQNDYLYDLLNPSQQNDGQATGFVNMQFEKCQPQ